jgi:putative flavoprotein involved in K+ transport
MSDIIEPSERLATDPTAASQAVERFLGQLDDALSRNDVQAAAALFTPDCHWRDLLAFTWNIKTVEGPDAVAAMLDATLPTTRPTSWRQNDTATTDAGGIVTGWFAFETETARARGHLRIRDGLCWTILTTMIELKGHEERRGRTREPGAPHGIRQDRRNWLERRQHEIDTLGLTEQPYVLIIGGGQGGLGLGARLRRLGVPTIIVDAYARPGDQWRSRYKSLCLHDPVWYDHMPYLPFPDHWPVYSPKDKIGDWLEMYAKVMELNCWNSTRCTAARYDGSAAGWIVELDRDGTPVTVRPKHLVLATGLSGVPNIPDIAGAETFAGIQHHSSKHPGGEAYEGKSCVVIGSNNSAHDICADLWEHGADVTMVQRSSTMIARVDSLFELTTSTLYSEQALEAGIDTEKADLLSASVPYRLMGEFQRPAYEKMRERDAEFYDRLRRAGFLLDFGDDDTGLFMKYVRRGSGYYIDVGASDLIADGKIKLERGAVVKIRPNSVLLEDGTELPADLIVYATGYGPMNGWAAKLISQEVADRVGKCWGYGSDTIKDPGPFEGELRNMWKPTHQEALWFHGGNLHQSRHYSLPLALQLKARKEAIPTPVYGMEPVHHLS